MNSPTTDTTELDTPPQVVLQKDDIIKIIREYNKTIGFSDRKLTDTPSDALQVVPRKYITNNGTVRPTSSVVGQPFFDTSLASGRGKPIIWNGTGWVDSTGTYV